ncbi:hypothetical protein HWV62_43610 [Athelia sp. TMB]|nr:hypothetical protein HWV62_43610 [Athelia sp. TMB]
MNSGAKDSVRAPASLSEPSRNDKSPSSTSDLPVPPAVPAAAPMSTPAPPPSDSAPQEKDKDKSSLATTLTGTNKTNGNHPRTMNTSENAPSSSTHGGDLEKTAASSSSPLAPKEQANGQAKATKGANAKGAKKPGFLVRIFRGLVPCAGPSAAHPIDLPESPSAHASSDALREKQAQVEAAQPVPGPSQPTPSEQAPPALIVPTLSIPTTAVDTADLPLTPVPAPTIVTGDDAVLLAPAAQLLPAEETEGVTSGAVQAPGSTGDELGHGHDGHHVYVHHTGSGTTDGTGDEEYEDAEGQLEVEQEDDEDRLIRQGGAGIPIGEDGKPRPLLPPVAPHHAGRKCLVLDLDETLVHSSFKSIQQADYIVPVEIDHHWHNFYVLKRPGVDEFLRAMGEIYEVVVFTASLSVYADPVLDKLDVHQAVTHRLFRESCYNHKGNYVKDLSQLGRPMTDTIILDNSPASYIFHQNNAVPVSSWFNDPHDTELTDMSPFLADLTATEDIRSVLDASLL